MKIPNNFYILVCIFGIAGDLVLNINPAWALIGIGLSYFFAKDEEAGE